MIDYFELGSSPVMEDCVQVDKNKPEYLEQMHAECLRYLELLKTIFPIPDSISNDVSFKVKSFSHDFGPYYEVVLLYRDTINEACAFAIHVESNLPEYWTSTEIRKFEFEEEYEDIYEEQD